jgi:hypothetical protein
MLVALHGTHTSLRSASGSRTTAQTAHWTGQIHIICADRSVAHRYETNCTRAFNEHTLATRQVPYAPLLKQTHQYSLRGAIHVHQTPKNLRPEVKTPQHSNRDIPQRNGRPCRTSRPGCVYCSSTHHLDTPPTSIESPSHDTHTRQNRLQPRYMNVTYK